MTPIASRPTAEQLAAGEYAGDVDAPQTEAKSWSLWPVITDARLAARRDIKRKIAERDVLKKRLEAFNERMAELDREADAAADAHRDACGPLQDELKNLEEQIIALTVSREAIPDHAEARRRELLKAIDVENDTLSDATDRVKRLRQPLVKEAASLRLLIADGAALENQLTHPGVADPELLAQSFVAQEAYRWATARVEAAQAKISTNVGWARDAENRGDKTGAAAYLARNEKWQAELTAAREVERAARLHSERARQAILDAR